MDRAVVDKLKSRKMWLSIAAFLGSIGMSVAGLATDNTTIATVGIVCSMLSAAIYSAAEAYIDASKKEDSVE